MVTGKWGLGSFLCYFMNLIFLHVATALEPEMPCIPYGCAANTVATQALGRLGAVEA